MNFREESLLKKSNKWAAISAIATVLVAITTMVIGYFSYRVSERSVQIAEDAKNLVELNNIQDLFTRVDEEALTDRHCWANAVVLSFYDKFIVDLDLPKEKLEEISQLLFSGDLDYQLIGLKYDYSNFEKKMIKIYYSEFFIPVNGKMHFENLLQSLNYKLSLGLNIYNIAKETKSSESLIRKTLQSSISFRDYSLMKKMFLGEKYLKSGYGKELDNYLRECYGNDLDSEKSFNEELRKERMEYKEYFKKWSKAGGRIYATDLKNYWKVRNNKNK